jgi:hypothetical protein
MYQLQTPMGVTYNPDVIFPLALHPQEHAETDLHRTPWPGYQDSVRVVEGAILLRSGDG